MTMTKQIMLAMEMASVASSAASASHLASAALIFDA